MITAMFVMVGTRLDFVRVVQGARFSSASRASAASVYVRFWGWGSARGTCLAEQRESTFAGRGAFPIANMLIV